MSELTPRERAVYESIIVFKFFHDGCAPSYGEIMEDTDITTTSMVGHYLKNLERKGMIKRFGGPKASRNIMVLGGYEQEYYRLNNMILSAPVLDAVVTLA